MKILYIRQTEKVGHDTLKKAEEKAKILEKKKQTKNALLEKLREFKNKNPEFEIEAQEIIVKISNENKTHYPKYENVTILSPIAEAGETKYRIQTDKLMVKEVKNKMGFKTVVYIKGIGEPSLMLKKEEFELYKMKL